MKIKKLLPILLVLLLAVIIVNVLGTDTGAEIGQTAAETVIELLEEPEAPPEEAPDISESEPSDAEEPPAEPSESEEQTEAEPEALVSEDGIYTSKDEVALYIHLYGHLPSNFVTKRDAKAAGWEGGSLDPYFDGMSIGGDRFGNYEGLLPDAPGRKWTECDINTMHARSRGAERIVYSNDGLIYYTGDHYESFEQLY